MPNRGYGITDTDDSLIGVVFPMGECDYFNTTGTAIAIAAQSDGSSNMVLLNPVTTHNPCSHLFTTNDAGRMTYTGLQTKCFHTAITLSISPLNQNETFVVGLAINGVVGTGKIIQKVANTSDTQAFSFHSFVELATNDYIEVYIGNISSANDVNLKTLNMFAMGA